MRLEGNFPIDFISIEKIIYEIDGKEVVGREIAFREHQKYGNLKANKETMDALEAANLAPFTPIEVTIQIDTEVQSQKNYRVIGASLNGKKLNAPNQGGQPGSYPAGPEERNAPAPEAVPGKKK